MRSSACSIAGKRETGRAEDPQEAASGHRLDNLDRADAVGHRARHAREPQSVAGPELRVSQVFEPAAGMVGDELRRHRPSGPSDRPSVTISWRPDRSITRNDSATRESARSRVSASVGATTTMVLRNRSVHSAWQGSINQVAGLRAVLAEGLLSSD